MLFAYIWGIKIRIEITFAPLDCYTLHIYFTKT